MKFRDYTSIVLATALTASPIYAQEKKFKDYKDGNPVVMIHSDIADTTQIEGNSLKNYLIKEGGAESVVKTPKTITNTIIKTDTVYIREKTPNQIRTVNSSSKSLESKAENAEKWYNKRIFGVSGLTAKTIFCTSAALTSIYFISDSISKHNDKNHTHDNKQNTPEDEYNLPEPPANTGIGGGRTGDSETGGARQ